MNRAIHVATMLAFVAATAAGCGGSDDAPAIGEVVIDGMAVRDAWVRPTPPDAAEAAIYLEVENVDAPADRIVGVTATRCSTVVPHQTVVDADGVASMPGIIGDELDLSPGSTVTMAPLGLHLMCLGLGAPLESGDEFDLTIEFDAHAPMTVTVAVDNR